MFELDSYNKLIKQIISSAGDIESLQEEIENLEKEIDFLLENSYEHDNITLT